MFPRRTAVSSALAVVASLALAGCGGGIESLSIGDTAELEIQGKPFEVTVSSFTEAPASLVAQFDDDDSIYFADVSFRYVGEADATDGLPTAIYNSVFSELSSGDFLRTTFTGLSECRGAPEDAAAFMEDLASGETVSLCVPLSSDGDDDVTGVYVGPTNINTNAGKIWKP